MLIFQAYLDTWPLCLGLFAFFMILFGTGPFSPVTLGKTHGQRPVPVLARARFLAGFHVHRHHADRLPLPGHPNVRTDGENMVYHGLSVGVDAVHEGGQLVGRHARGPVAVVNEIIAAQTQVHHVDGGIGEQFPVNPGQLSPTKSMRGTSAVPAPQTRTENHRSP